MDIHIPLGRENNEPNNPLYSPAVTAGNKKNLPDG